MNGSLVIKKKSLLEYIFFSNYFYGICAVALSVEASLQQRLPLNGVQYFGLIFISTVLYYAYPYIRRDLRKTTNPRTNWYRNNYNLMRWNQVIITAILVISAIIFLSSYPNVIMRMTFVSWLLLLIFPVAATSYYGISFLSRKYNLRKIGWLKPFIIGFTWAGLVTIYPVLFYLIINNEGYQFTWVGTLFFLKISCSLLFCVSCLISKIMLPIVYAL
jgi:hypothetical protein